VERKEGEGAEGCVLLNLDEWDKEKGQ
jgi:hypothetical protein